MKNKKIINGLLLLVMIISLCNIAYADFYSKDTEFTMIYNNVTYNFTRDLICDSLVDDGYCLNITGGDDAHNYCNSSATPLTIYIFAPPVISTYEPLLNPTINEPENTTFNISVYDVDENVLTYSWEQNSSEVATTQNFTFIGNYTSAGTYNISVTVFDGNGTTSHEWLLTVSETDIVNPDVTIVKESSAVEFGIENNTINWTVSDNVNIDVAEINITYPNGSLLFNSNAESGSILLQPANLTAIGIYGISLWANDTSGNSNSTSDSFLANDTLAPTLDQPLQNITRRSDQPLVFDVNASDPSGIDSYTLSDNVYFKISSSGLLENKTFTPKGIYNLTINITDNVGNVLTGDLTFMVVNTTNSPPSLSEVTVLTIGEGVHDYVYCNGGTYLDIDSDIEVGRYYKWYINLSYIKNSTLYSVSLYENLTKGDNVSCEVLTTDGYESIARNSSNQITIINTEPYNTAVPTVNKISEVLLDCVNGTWADYDAGDSINESQYKWYSGSTEVGDTQLFTVPSAGSYYCSQRVADGENWSAWVDSEVSSDTRYTASDLPNIISDNVGEAGVKAKVWAGLMIGVSIIVGILLL